MTVFADSPGAAYSQAAARDQERVANYLRSMAQNRQAQESSYDAWARQAAQRQAAEERQQNQAMQVAQYIANTRQNREAETYKRGQDALTMMLRKKGFDQDAKWQNWQMGQPTKAQVQAQEDAQFEGERAGKSESLARYFEEQRALNEMLNATPGSASAPSPAAASSAAYKRPNFWERLTSLDAGYGRNKELQAEAMRDYASDTPYNLPADFSAAKSLPDMYAARTSALQARLRTLAPFTQAKDAADFVELGPEGRVMPRFRRSPGGVFGQTQTGTTGGVTAPVAQTQTVTQTQPKLATREIAFTYLNAAGGNKQRAYQQMLQDGYAP